MLSLKNVFYEAIKAGDEEVVQFLLKEKKSLLEIKEERWLFPAIKNNNYHLIPILLEQGEQFQEMNIHSFAKKGNIEWLKYCQKNGLLNHRVINDSFCFAAEKNQIEVMDYLYTLGANIRDDREHALRYAIEKNNLEAVSWLLEKRPEYKKEIIENKYNIRPIEEEMFYFLYNLGWRPKESYIKGIFDSNYVELKKVLVKEKIINHEEMLGYLLLKK